MNCFNFSELFTGISDIIISLICLKFYVALRRLEKKKEYIAKWSLFYLFVSVATLAGGIAHIFSGCKLSMCYRVTWVCMQLFTGAAVFQAQSAVFYAEIRNRRTKKVLISIARLQFLIYLPCVIYFMDFKVTAINSLIGLTQLFILSFPNRIHNFAYRSLISLGIFISFLTVYVNRQKITFSEWFSHNDLAHILILASLVLFYRGILYRHQLDSLFNR